LHQPRMMRKWSNGEFAVGRGKPLGQNPVSLLFLSTTNPTLIVLGLNSDHRGKKPKTNRLDLSHGCLTQYLHMTLTVLSAVHTGKNSEYTSMQSTVHNLLFIDIIGAFRVPV
jgi:hypothetical protein